MYRYHYFITMKITTRMKAPFSQSELCKLEKSRVEHNHFFAVMPKANTNNRKYISKIDITNDGKLGFYLETECPLNNVGRRGNALRFFSIVAANNGLDLFVKNHRLMKSA